jgi:protoporphyrinogen oxidase
MRMRIAVLGGGLAGLASAHYLGRAGHEAVLVGSSESFGSLSQTFSTDRGSLPRFPHPLLPTDSALCGLAADLGLSDRLAWGETSSALGRDGELWPLDSIRDVLGPGTRPSLERLRRSWSWALAARRPRYALHLDDVPATEWARRHLGPRAFESSLAPLLQAQYGEYSDETPAYLLRSRIRQGAGRIRGSIRGGFQALGQRLAESITGAGGKLLLGCRADRVDWESGRALLEVDGRVQDFDAVVSTLTLPGFAKIAGDGLLRHLPFAGLPYQGLICVAVVCRRRFTPYHQTWIADRSSPFWSVEHPLAPGSETSPGCEVAYLKCSAPEHSERFRASDGSMIDQALDTLASLYPAFERSDVVAACVTRRPEVEPFWTLGARRRRPPVTLPATRVFLCTGAQAYPRRLGADSCVILARETAQRVLQS